MAIWKQRKSKHSFDKNDSIVEKLAKVRGVSNLSEWFNPPEKYLHSPYLLNNIDDVAQRIVKAIHTGEKITVMADIDADGVFACAGMVNYLSPLVEDGRVDYIYSQRSKGHGLKTVVEELADKKEEGSGKVKYLQEDTDLLIIVDSSSNSADECKFVSETMGVDIVIIDHHKIEVENPHATIVNCQIGKYPNKHLSGSAMVLKVCEVIDDYMAIENSWEFVDLATIGLISDMMSVLDSENRHMIHHGLANIKNAGLHALFKLNKIESFDDVGTTDIAFKISPVINACTRYDKIELALELFTTEDGDRVLELAKEMIELNNRRKSELADLYDNVVENVNNEHSVSYLFDEEIGSGFRGLIATQITESFGKPVFVLKPFYDENGNITKYAGSARSVGNLPLYSMCKETNLFNYVMGHEGAFGLDINIDKFDQAMKLLDEMIGNDVIEKEYVYDLEIDAEEVSEMDIKEIEKFSRITGQGFSTPVFKVKGLIAEEKSTKKLGSHVRAVMGSDGRTVKVNMSDDWAIMKFRSSEGYGLDIHQHYYSGEHFMTEVEVIGELNLNSFYNWGTRKLEVTKQVFAHDYIICEN